MHYHSYWRQYGLLIFYVMRKIYLALLSTFISLPAMSFGLGGNFRYNAEKTYYGVRLGINLSALTGDASLKTDGHRTGLYLGGVMGFRLSRPLPLYLESGVVYTERGGKQDGSTCTLNSFEIPMVVKYGITTGTATIVSPFLGPYFSYAVSGKTTGGLSAFKEGGFNHGDMGLKVGCGIDYYHLYLEASYQYGLLNISSLPGVAAHTSNFNVSVGFNF